MELNIGLLGGIRCEARIASYTLEEAKMCFLRKKVVNIQEFIQPGRPLITVIDSKTYVTKAQELLLKAKNVLKGLGLTYRQSTVTVDQKKIFGDLKISLGIPPSLL